MIIKTCLTCKEEKYLEEFTKDRRGKDGTSSYCKKCHNKRLRIFYHKDKNISKEKYLKYSSDFKKRNRIQLFKYLEIHPCVDCKETNILVLEADHLRDKDKNISALIQSRNWKSILKELEKCEIVCSNCHQIRTNKRANSYRLQYLNGTLT